MKKRGKKAEKINCVPQDVKGTAKSGQILVAGLIVIILISLVMIGSVLHSWKEQYRGGEKWSQNTAIQDLQAQVNALKKEVAKNKAGAATTATSKPLANQNAQAIQNVSVAFEKAVNDKDFPKIEMLMATQVYFVEDATDCCGNITKKEAATNLKKYIAGATSFNFDQNQQVVKQMKVNLADTFAKYTIGIADNKMVLSYHLDGQGKVDDLMLSASHLMYDLE